MKYYKYGVEKLQNFEVMYIKINVALYKYIYSLVKDQRLADDVLQRTALDAYLSIDDLRDRNKFKSWIFTIAKRNAIHDIHLTKHEYLTNEMIDFIDNKYKNIEGNTPLLCDITNDIVDTLEPKYKEIITLIYYNDFNISESAEIMDIKYNTAKSRHIRALQIIKIRIDEYTNKSYKKSNVVVAS